MDFISKDWLFPLAKRIVELREQRNKEIQNISDEFGDPLLLSKFYIEPRCQHHNPADGDEDEGRALISTECFQTINNFLNRKYQTRDGRSQLFILSDAGMGKTSLLMMLKLLNLTSFWPKHYQCKLYKLDGETLDKVEKISDKSNTVLLLDALDEDPKAWGRIRLRVFELLSYTKNFRNVIISCRTQFFPEKELDPFGEPGRVIVEGFRCPMFFLSLFNDDQVHEYLKKKFPKNVLSFFGKSNLKSKDNIDKAQYILEKMGSLRLRPLLLSHIEDLVSSNESSWDAYKVYEILVDVWLRREQVKIRECYKEQGHCPEKSDLLLACIYLAEYMQHKGSRTVSSGEISSLIEEHPKISYLENFSIGGRSLLNRNSESKFRFSHYSIQEFLLAFGITTNVLAKVTKPIRATDQILFFLGLSECDQLGLHMLDVQNFDLGAHFRRNKGIAQSLRNAKLSGANLEGADLEGADMEGADLRQVNLTKANLTNANLKRSNISSSILIETRLKNADLANANLQWANLQQADLTGASLKKADIQNADFLCANLSGVNMDGAKTKGANFDYSQKKPRIVK